VAAAVTALALACGGDASGPGGAVLTLEIEGRPERGLVVSLTARERTGTLAAGATWQAEPASAVAFLEGDRARLLQAGPVTLRATVGSATGTLAVTVAVPPLIVLEASGPGGRTLHEMRLDGTELRALPVGPGESIHPAVAAGILVYVNYRHGNGELFRLPLNAGGTAQRLTTTATDEIQPALSPDGSRLAFVGAAGGLPRVFVAGPDATSPVRAAPAHGGGAAIEGNPSWAPHGDRLAFMSTAGGRAGIYVVTLASGQVETLRAGVQTFVEPAWSPDGRYLAYVVSSDAGTDLFMTELVTGIHTQLTNRTEADGRPAWLPDGRLLYTSWNSGVPGLRWLDPAAPAEFHEIPLALPRAERAVAR
jgi:dipeptidyl aminopeptidase/acylaminoacyl peptidase